VIGEALDRDVPAGDADDPLHDADRGPPRLQDTALFDVDLEIGRDVALRPEGLAETLRIAADRGDALLTVIPAWLTASRIFSSRPPAMALLPTSPPSSSVKMMTSSG